MRLNYLDIPFELNLTEEPDLGMLELITNRFHELKIPFTNPKNVDGDKVIGNGALKIWNTYRNKVLEGDSISYQSSTKNKPNRMYAKGSSCQGLPSIIRNSLYRNKATDTDIKVCHPTIARSIAKHFELPYFMFNDLIENREEILSKFVDRLGWTRTQAKKETNRLLMGGGMPIEVKKDPELWEWMEKYKAECKGLASFICTTYPALFKDSQKREKDNPYYSTLSIFICNIENQIVLKAMEYKAQQGVKIYVYTFDGYLHSKWDGEYSELNEYILRETGIPIEFVSKEMENFIQFDNVLELKELQSDSKEELKEISLKVGLEFDFKCIEKLCVSYSHFFPDSKEIIIDIIRKYCDNFFTTIETENDHLIAMDSFHVIQDSIIKKNFTLSKFNKFKVNYCADKSTVAGFQDGAFFKPCFSLWNHYFLWENKRKMSRIDFYPSFEKQLFYNVYIPTIIVPSKKIIKKDMIQPFIDHIEKIWCEGNIDHANFVLKWMAKCIQTPWDRTGSCIVLKGAEGCGKGIIVSHFLGNIIGGYNQDTGKFGGFRPVVKDDELFGRFTNILEGCLLLYADEMTWGGDKKASGRLKALITEESVRIEHKGLGSYPMRSFINLMIASNEQWVIPAGENTRRYLVLECNNKYAGVQNKEIKEYFDQLLSVPVQDVADFLYQLDLTGFNSKEVPLTKALDEQKELGMDSSYTWLMDHLSDPEGWNSDFQKKAEVYHQYTDWCKENHVYKTISECIFWKHMKHWITNESRRNDNGIRYYSVQFNTHSESLAIFKNKFKMDIKIIL